MGGHASTKAPGRPHSANDTNVNNRSRFQISKKAGNFFIQIWPAGGATVDGYSAEYRKSITLFHLPFENLQHFEALKSKWPMSSIQLLQCCRFFWWQMTCCDFSQSLSYPSHSRLFFKIVLLLCCWRSINIEKGCAILKGRNFRGYCLHGEEGAVFMHEKSWKNQQNSCQIPAFTFLNLLSLYRSAESAVPLALGPGNVQPGNVRPGNVRSGNVRPGNVLLLEKR